ncbi:GNAT family N-acetyltransferase [Modestobacter sp. VKM Ac-2984]|uniref:GNAT family N-acetyltransferase n=1 Tax=Modestobacter sp. VKM Ac-2984 TaxID=3004138 RepID=UPI0022AAFE90|nr:GNAT family N-acetyltransferase [Modestobacter sp. VKM Ac-2984]MCZ2817640.1 GNAT family N-acetyltransferase [Modestobacter sp. VKM Ac-2984]
MRDRTDLSLSWLPCPEAVSEQLRAELTACWRDVANAGGAVGFAQQLPVTDDVVRAAVDDTVAGLGAGRLLVARRDGELAGWLLLTTNADPVRAHWGRVTRVMTALSARGSGAGRALMTELGRAAREDLGLDRLRLRLEVRGGTGYEAFYARFGWQVIGRWPGALAVTPEDRRDELLMSLTLTEAPGAS